VVSAAAGAVGSVAGQLAKVMGCRAVGVAGGRAKCDLVVHELGFDACVDYKSESFRGDFKAATENRIDVVFENVGGAVLDDGQNFVILQISSCTGTSIFFLPRQHAGELGRLLTSAAKAPLRTPGLIVPPPSGTAL